MNIWKTIRLPLFAAATTLFVAGPASATWNWKCKPAPSPADCVVKVIADDRYEPRGANGSWNNDRFWSIDFDQAVCEDAYIKEVTIDLQAGSDHDAYFDLSGGDKHDWAFGPKIGELRGLDESDVSFSPEDGDTSTLTVTFEDGAFKVGDRIWFGADTDHLGSGDRAISVGYMGVGVSVTFGNGSTYSSSFSYVGNCVSKATVRAEDCCAPTVIPTPSAVGLGMLMLGGVAIRRRRSAE